MLDIVKDKYDSETGEFYVFINKWEIDHDFTCILKYMIHIFTNMICADINVLTGLLEKTGPEDELFNHLVKFSKNVITLKNWVGVIYQPLL